MLKLWFKIPLYSNNLTHSGSCMSQDTAVRIQKEQSGLKPVTNGERKEKHLGLSQSGTHTLRMQTKNHRMTKTVIVCLVSWYVMTKLTHTEKQLPDTQTFTFRESRGSEPTATYRHQKISLQYDNKNVVCKYLSHLRPREPPSVSELKPCSALFLMKSNLNKPHNESSPADHGC